MTVKGGLEEHAAKVAVMHDFFCNWTSREADEHTRVDVKTVDKKSTSSLVDAASAEVQ